jgi:phosphatidylglycerophosphate synthase
MISPAELRKKCQPKDLDLCLYRRAIVRKLSIYPTWLFLRMGVSANAVSILKNALACSGAMLFAPGRPWPAVAGALLLQLAFLLDASDGEVARFTGSSATAGGEFIDKLGDAASRGLFYGAWGFAVGTTASFLTGAFIAGTWLVVRFCALETVLESMCNHPGIPPSAEEREAAEKLFVRSPGGGRAEYLLSLLFHPWINMAALAAAAAFHPPVFRLLFWAYCLLWLLNTVRKIRQYYVITNFKRP